MAVAELESISCNFCKSGNYKLLYKAKPNRVYYKEMFYPTSANFSTGNIVKCRNCGLIYANPRLRHDLLLKFYHEGEDLDYIRQQKVRVVTFCKVLKFIEKFSSGGTMLDVGCGAGFLLSAAKEKN